MYHKHLAYSMYPRNGTSHKTAFTYTTQIAIRMWKNNNIYKVNMSIKNMCLTERPVPTSQLPVFCT